MSYNTTPHTNKQPNIINELNQQIDESKETLLKACDNVLERGNSIDDINAKAANLELNSKLFRNESKKIKNKMWWKSHSCYIILFISIVITLIIIIVSSKKKT